MRGKMIVSEVETGIPVPEPRRDRSELRQKLHAMKVGDSILVQGSMDTARAIAREVLGAGKSVSLKTGEGLRIWRKA